METGSGNDGNNAPMQQTALTAGTAAEASTASSSAGPGATVAGDDAASAAAGMGGGATPGQSSTSGGPAAPPTMRDREGSFSSYVSSLDGSNVAQLGSNCGSVVEHSPQGRYVRFNFRLEAHAYKEVWKAFDTSEGVEVAWNTLCLDEVPRTDKKRILNEIKILEKLDHPNIITFYTSWFNKETRRIVFITDLMNNNNNGSLMEFVRPIPVLRWKIVKRWLKQILEGLAFLHGQQPPIIHRNINCDNIFIIANTGELKIGDLGLSTAAQRPEGCVGTAPFMAPELFEEDYDERVDIYAFGMAILQMITKKQPYSECENRVGEVYQRVTNHIPPESLATVDLASARAFVELCLEPEPTLRPTATELLEHRFLKEDKVEDGLEVIITKPTPSSASAATTAAAAFAAGPGASGGNLSSTPVASSVFGSTSSGVIPVPADPMYRHSSHDSLGSAAAGVPAPAPAPATSTRLLPFLSSAGGGGEVGELLTTATSGGDVGQSKAQVQVSNGSKLHLRFFSEPHGSFSEVSSDDGGGGDSDLDEEGGADAAAIEASMGDGSLLGSQSGASLVHTGSKGGGFSSRHAHGLSLDPEAMLEEEHEDYYLMGADVQQQHAQHAALHPPEATADDVSGSPSRSGRAVSGAGVGVSGFTLSLSGLGSFFGGNGGGGGSQPARSPRSLLREETLDSNDDDLLSEMPTAESSIKKVKVMGARGTELVEEEWGDGAAGGSKDKASPAAGGGGRAADVPPGGGNGEEKKEEGATAVGAAAGGSASKPPAAGGGGLTRSKLSSHNMQALLANAISEGMMRRSPSSAAMDEMQRKGSFFNTPTTGSRSASPTAISAGLQGAPRPPPVMGPVGPGGLPPKSPAARTLLAKGVAGGAKKAHFNAPDSPGGTSAAAAAAEAAPGAAGGTAAAAPGGPAPTDTGVGEPDTLPEALPRLSSYNLSVVEAASWGSSSSGGSGGEDDASSVAGSICSGWSEEGEAPHHAGGDHHARLARRMGESAASSTVASQQPSVHGKAAPGAPAGSRGRMMTLLIQTLVKGKPTEVEFEFDLDVDSPPAVAQEMVQELGIPLREMEGLARQIGGLKEELLAKRAARRAAKAKQPHHPHSHPHPHPPQSLSSQSHGSLPTEPASPFPALGLPGPHHPVPSGTSIGHPLKAPPAHRFPGAGAGAAAAASAAAVATTPAQPPTSRPTSVSAPPAVVGGGTEPPLPLPLESLQALRLTDIDEADADDEEEDAEDLELQRMKGEYIKSVQRAQKAFKARMESMYKCREDKEEWHRKLVDQYERAVADFDRRLHAATDDQARRLTELRTQFATLRTHHRQSKQPVAGVGVGAGGPVGMVGSVAAKGASSASS